MAMDASKQHRRSSGSDMPVIAVPAGSVMTANPSMYVDTRVAKLATSCRALKSSSEVISRVRSKEFKRVYVKRSGFLSRAVTACMSCRKANGVSLVTSLQASLVLKYWAIFFKKATKCSAFRMLPGTASSKMSADSTGFAKSKSAADVPNPVPPVGRELC